MLRSLLLPSLALLQVSCFSNVTFDIDAERLDDADGVPMQNTGLVILVVDRNEDGFLAPNTTWFTQNDDLIIDAWQIGNPFGPGTFQPPTLNFPLGNNIDSGDPLKLLWFPTLTSTNAPPVSGTQFGEFEGDPAWVIPPDGLDGVNLTFLTADAAGGGPYSAQAGDALSVVPEPATYAAVFAASCLGWAVARRRIKQA